MSRCQECDVILFSYESKKFRLCHECRNPDLYDALESATDLEEKLEIILKDGGKNETQEN